MALLDIATIDRREDRIVLRLEEDQARYVMLLCDAERHRDAGAQELWEEIDAAGIALAWWAADIPGDWRP